ncbi:MAG TPA: ATP-binding protein [Stellaceae bacterium]|nr:ATP-binding protein [Stellaceae bacterium]
MRPAAMAPDTDGRAVAPGEPATERRGFNATWSNGEAAMVRGKFLSFIDWFVPQSLRGETASFWRARIFVISHLFGPCLGASIVAYLIDIDSDHFQVWVIAICDLIFMVLPFGLKLTGRLAPLALTSVATLTFVSLYGSYYYGGVSSPFLPWVLVALLLGFFYLRERPVLLFSVYGINLATFYVAYLLNGGFAQRIPTSGLAGVGILSVCCATIYTAMMAIYYASIVTSQSELEQEVQRHLAMAVKLRRVKEEAERANRAKSVFLAKMSHQLRTPLNAVIGYSEILLEDDELGANGEHISDLKRINSAGKHLLALVTNVLDLSKIDSQNVDLSIESFDLKQFIDEVADTCRSLVINNSNEFKIEYGERLGAVATDPTRLRQALLNLLSNAGKFTKRGTVTLSVCREQRGDADWLKIAVRDSGIGISREHLARLFTAFNQAEASTSSRYGGTGLGLALSQSLCRAMRGEIMVDSDLGRGSCFTIEIPAELELEEAPPAPAAEPAPAGVEAMAA